MPRLHDLFREPGGKPRLADAGVARDEDNLALATPGAALARKQVRPLGLAPDEAREPRRMRRLEAALTRRNAKRRENLNRLGEALDDLPAQPLQAELVADEPPRRC